MSFLKRKLAIAGAVLSVVMSAAILGNSLIYAFSEDYKSWKQYGSSWSTMYLGSSSDTVKASGCAVTSAAILMVHSGSVTSDDFNPGVIVNFLNHNGGFSSGGLLNWWALSAYAPDFKYVDSYNVLKGTTQAEKAQEIKNYLDEGYYVMVRISNAKMTHFVAVDSVSGSRVTMMDPGSSSTSLFDKYNVSDVTQVRLFRGKNSSAETSPEEDDIQPLTEACLDAPETAPVMPETFPPETTTIIETTTAPATTTTTAATTTTTTTTTSVTTTTTTTTSVTTTTTTTTSSETTTTTAETTTSAPVTTSRPATTTEIIITTKATTAAESPVILYPEAAAPAEENSPEEVINPAEEEISEVSSSNTIEIIILQDAPETAPVSGEDSSAEIQKTKTLLIPEEQAAATLVEIKQQHIFMSIRFTIKTDLHLRQEANTDSEVLAVIPANTSLNVVEVDEDFKWGRVLYNGCEGWIALNFAEL
ncbi:MAG: SH3 domain-containing protein [Oscillospiraceae bacterium]|nr:SH3 domain-containing protein [Oscillospiraceae bacterium]